MVILVSEMDGAAYWAGTPLPDALFDRWSEATDVHSVRYYVAGGGEKQGNSHMDSFSRQGFYANLSQRLMESSF
jgi:hypothetical protein